MYNCPRVWGVHMGLQQRDHKGKKREQQEQYKLSFQGNKMNLSVPNRVIPNWIYFPTKWGFDKRGAGAHQYLWTMHTVNPAYNYSKCYNMHLEVI